LTHQTDAAFELKKDVGGWFAERVSEVMQVDVRSVPAIVILKYGEPG
jgi:hypothetical protein